MACSRQHRNKVESLPCWRITDWINLTQANYSVTQVTTEDGTLSLESWDHPWRRARHLTEMASAQDDERQDVVLCLCVISWQQFACRCTSQPHSTLSITTSCWTIFLGISAFAAPPSAGCNPLSLTVLRTSLFGRVNRVWMWPQHSWWVSLLLHMSTL